MSENPTQLAPARSSGLPAHPFGKPRSSPRTEGAPPQAELAAGWHQGRPGQLREGQAAARPRRRRRRLPRRAEAAPRVRHRHARLSPLPPEGASVILHGSTEFAPQTARRQRVSATDLLADGTVHAIVPEHAPAHEDPAAFARRIAAECLRQIDLQRRP